MHGYWKEFGLHTALGRFMTAVERRELPASPPDVTRAIRLAHDELLQRHVPLADIAEFAWRLSAYCQDGGSHDLALVTALHFLCDPDTLSPRLEHVRRDARHCAQEWMTQGSASMGVVSRFEEALFRRFP